MCLGVPVVTCSTPWVDNAQIEQVDEGETGHVADHPVAFAEAVAALVLDEAKRERFGRAAAAKSDRLFDATMLTRQLERLYEALARGEAPPGEWVPPPAEVDAFAAEYRDRLAASFRELSAEERREERREFLRERATWAARAARSNLNPGGLRYAAGVVRARLGDES